MAPHPSKTHIMKYDLIVIGSGPSGQHGALAAAKLQKRVALVENRLDGWGGTNIHAGAIPSKALREAAMLLTGFRHRHVYPQLFTRRGELTMDQVMQLAHQVMSSEAAAVEQQLRQHDVALFAGHARFTSPHDLEVTNGPAGNIQLNGDKILMAVGSKPIRPEWVPFDGDTVFDSDELLLLDRIPKSMVVIGGGVVGLEYSMIFAVLGTRVTIVDSHPRLLSFCDHEVSDALLRHSEDYGVSFRLGRPVTAIERQATHQATVRLEGGKSLTADAVLYASGRCGNTDHLNVRAAGLMPDEQGRLWCNDHFQTWVNHIYGVGDVVGFPALASVSMEQGRRAVQHAFGQPVDSLTQIPYGLFTIPELAMIGPSEEQLSHDLVPYEVGIANFQDVSRGHIGGTPFGLLKLLFHRESLKLLGVHCLGETATELIHVGQAVMSFGGTIEYFRDNVFNYPTMSECYRLAAANALNHLEITQLQSKPIVMPISHDVAMNEEVEMEFSLALESSDGEETLDLLQSDEVTLMDIPMPRFAKRQSKRADMRHAVRH